MRPLTRFTASLVLLALAVPATAQLVSGRFTTAFYAWEKYDSSKTSSQYLRGFQNIQLNIAQGNLSLHTYLQGAVNVNSPFGDHGYLRVFNLYLRWANIFRAVDLSLGRQSIFAGAGNNTLDGLQAKLRLFKDAVGFTLYGGATVKPDLGGFRKDDYKQNYMVGGQVLVYPTSSLRLGLSYMNRHEQRDPYWTERVRDTMYAAIPYYISNYSEAYQYASADVSYMWGQRLSVYGRYDYDVNQEQTSRAEFSARVGVTNELALLGYYIHRVPRLDFSSIFWVFAVTSVDEIEGGVEYALSKTLRGFARFAKVWYTDDKSHRWTVGLNSTNASISYAGSDGYAGQLQALNLQGAYPMADNTVIPSVAFSLASYRLSREQEERDLALSIVLGGTIRPSKNFSFDAQWQLMHNKLYNTDSRFFVKLNYWFAERLPFFGQEGK